MAATKKRPPAKAPAANPDRIPGRVPGRAGRNTLLLNGFNVTALDDGQLDLHWDPKSPAGQALAALAAGSDDTDAARFAGIHPATLRNWIARGENTLRDEPTAYLDPDPDLTREELAYLAFYVQSGRASTAAVVGALDAIDRARKGGSWQAAVAMLRHHPRAGAYRPTERREHSGPDGAPIPVATASLEVNVSAIVDLARRMAEERRDSLGS